MRWRFTLNPDTDDKLISEPIGWAEIEFSLVRSREWHGIFLDYTLPLKFYNDPKRAARDAYTYLKSEYELNGIEGFVIMKVELACDDNDDYTEQGKWRLSFTSYREILDESCLIELNMEPENYLMIFKSRYDQKVDLDTLVSFDGTELDAYDMLGASMSFPPKAIPVTTYLEVDWENPVEYLEQDGIPSGTGNETRDIDTFYQLGFPIVGLDEVTFRTDLVSTGYNSASFVNALFKVELAGDYTITINAGEDSPLDGAVITAILSVITEADNSDCDADNTFDQEMTVELFLQVAGVDYSLFSDTDTSFCATGGKTMNIEPAFYQNTFTLSVDDEIKFYARVYGKGKWDRELLVANDVNWISKLTFQQIGFKIQANVFSEPTNAKVYAINEVASRILEVITDDGFRFLSNYYGRTDSQPYQAPDAIDGCGSLRVLTMGLMLRQYANAKITASFKDVFENMSATDNVGIGTEPDVNRTGYEVIRMEPAEFFYDDDIILTLNKIPRATITIIPEEHISVFKFGYSKWEAEEYTGLDEFATRREYRTNLSTTTNTLEKVCSFIASGYAIEITRRKPWDEDTQEDWRFDQDNFIVCCKRVSGDFAVEQGNITDDINLIDAASVYNFRISPVRNAFRWLKTVLNSYRDPEAADSVIEFTNGEGNFIAQGLMLGGCPEEAAPIYENATLSINEAADPATARPLYIPELWEFEYPLSFTDYNLLKAGAKKTIRAQFRQEETYREFFIREVKYRPNEGMATFMLLPKRGYPINNCKFYIVQQRGVGTNIFGSSLLIDAELENLFVFVNGNLQKYNDAVGTNNEINSWDETTGYGTLKANIPHGQQVTIIHMPPQGHCGLCFHRFEGRGDGDKNVTLTGFGNVDEAQMFVFYNGRLMKYYDAVAANNEMSGYDGGTEVLTLKANTNVSRELRVFGFTQTCCSDIFNGHGDGTSELQLSGIGIATLANLLVFYNGNLGKYNDSNPASNDVLGYDEDTQIANFKTNLHPDRELRAVNFENC